MPRGCISFLLLVFWISLGLLGFVVIAANPWILILIGVALAIAIPLFLFYQAGRLAFRYPLIALLIVGLLILIAFLRQL